MSSTDSAPPPAGYYLYRLAPDQLRLLLAAVLGAGHRAREADPRVGRIETPRGLALAALADADMLIEAARRVLP